MRNDNGHYFLTDADVEAYKLILNVTYDLEIRSSGEPGLETHGHWRVSAPAGNKTYYCTDGYTLAEAIEKWFQRLKDNNVETFFEVSEC